MENLARLFSFFFGFISGVLLSLVLMSSAQAAECPLSEGLVCGEWDYTGGRTPNDVIHHPYTGQITSGNINVHTDDNGMEDLMKAMMVVIMVKVIQDMENNSENLGSDGCATDTER